MLPYLAEKKNATAAHVNLDEASRLWLKQRKLDGLPDNPLLDPDVCARMVKDVTRRLHVDVTYGGWMENRARLWRGSYLDDHKTYIHLGVDVNVAEYRVIVIDHPGVVIRVDSDDELHGWGTRVFVHLDGVDVILAYAHLHHQTHVYEGKKLKPEDSIGIIASPKGNGGWYPHLHVQAITKGHYEALLKNDLRDLDGYGAESDLETLKQLYPDPTPWLAIP